MSGLAARCKSKLPSLGRSLAALAEAANKTMSKSFLPPQLRALGARGICGLKAKGRGASSGVSRSGWAIGRFMQLVGAQPKSSK